MTYSSLPEEVRAAAERVLTRRQLDVYRLKANGLSERAIALKCRVTRRTVRDHLAEADIKIHRELEEAA